MSENLVFEPSAAAKARTLTSAAQYANNYARSVSDPDGFWARAGQAASTGSSRRPRSRTPASPTPTSRSNGSRTGCSTSPPTASTGTSRRAATRSAIIWEGDTPGTDGKVTYRELHERVCRFANVLKAQGRQEGRPRHHLHADGHRHRRRDARLRAHRRGAFGDLRRLLAGFDRRPHQRLRQPGSCSPPTKAGAAARPFRSRRTSTRRWPRRRASTRVIVVKVTGNDVDMQAGRDVWYARGGRKVVAPIARPSR